jgi:translation initiation factor 4G
MESQEARNARVKEEEAKKQEQEQEREKAESKEREAREAEEERVRQEAKAKEEAVSLGGATVDDANSQATKEAEDKAAEEKRKADEESAAKEAASKKQAEEEAAKAKAAKDLSDKAEADAATESAQDKANDQRKALLTPAPSAPGSPSSPSVAGLPPKPLAASASRRSVPAALDLKPSTPNPAEPTAMATAKPITDLASITYNAPFQSPSSDLNKGAEPGQFRYDRDFLMQFMEVCQERPDRLPPLEEIGLEADTSSGFGKRPGGGGRQSGGPSRGLGISGSGHGGPRQGMGSFGTGNFGSGAISTGGRLGSSEDRYKQSKVDMNRAGGHGGSMGPPRGGGRTPSGPGRKRAPLPQYTPFEPEVEPLKVTENAWVQARPDKKNEDTRSPTYVARKVKSLLNKLTEEKFDSIAKQILEFANYSVDETNGQSLKLVIKLIFDKATDEAHWSAMYAKLCRKMLDEVDPRVTENLEGKDVAGGALFRKYLVGRCQQDFETGWKEREDAVAKAAQKKEDDKQTLADHAATAGENSEPAVLSDEYYALQKAKRRGLGLVQLIGELFKREMVSKNVMKQCFLKLLGNVDDTDEEDIESACKLLTTIGAVYDRESTENVSGIMVRLAHIKDKETTSSRVKFMILASLFRSCVTILR